ncbi:MAG: hypothetical protein M0Z95_11730, partial [Actinomycetota bacterium]|nr:hypothetical protein [Actinomycetota bacterium]
MAVGKESKATFKLTYAYRNSENKGSYSVEQQPPDQLFRTSPPSAAELIYWSWHGLTDIHQKARSAGKDAHHGDHGAEEAPGP